MPPLNFMSSIASALTEDTSPAGALSSRHQQPKLQVDYDTNITKLYEAICNCEWDVAIQTARESPKEAQTWVVRYYNGEEKQGVGNKPEIMWRFLPIHSACARQPPASVISALIKAYPDGAACMDDQGMYALHYACGNQASREVIRLLLGAFPDGAKMTDPRNMLPIHYVACWGPSSVNIIDMLLVAHNHNVAMAKDADGNTALDLAKEGDYQERDAVVAALKRWFDNKKPVSSSARGSPTLPKLNPSRSASPSLQINTSRSSSPLQLMGGTSNNNNNTMTAAAGFKSDKENEDQLFHNRTVSRLRQEIAKIKAEKKQMEVDKEKEKMATLEKLNEQIEELSLKLSTTQQELDVSKTQGETLQSGMKEKENLLQSIEHQLDEANQKLVQVEVEKNELLQQLATLTVEHDKYQKKADNVNNRLGSLSASLTSMMETQSAMVRQIQNRDERLSSGYEFRLAKLEELLDFEEQLKNTIIEDPRVVAEGTTAGDAAAAAAIGAGGFGKAFEQQMKEMDAIAAVIAAMRQ